MSADALDDVDDATLLELAAKQATEDGAGAIGYRFLKISESTVKIVAFEFEGRCYLSSILAAKYSITKFAQARFRAYARRWFES